VVINAFANTRDGFFRNSSRILEGAGSKNGALYNLEPNSQTDTEIMLKTSQRLNSLVVRLRRNDAEPIDKNTGREGEK
jgi:hypothetical protein